MAVSAHTRPCSAIWPRGAEDERDRLLSGRSRVRIPPGSPVARQSYGEQLGEVLRGRDAGRLRRFLIENARKFGDARQVAELEGKSSEEMEELMQRMILARAELKDTRG